MLYLKDQGGGQGFLSWGGGLSVPCLALTLSTAIALALALALTQTLSLALAPTLP